MKQAPAPTRPLVSVIIVNFNGGPFLLDTVHSVLTSSVSLDIHVVDNGSSDGSICELQRQRRKEPRLRVIENKANLGFAAANNIALQQAEGEFLLLLNPDCLLQPDTLARMVEALRADPSAGMAGCLIRNPDGSEQAGCRRTIPTPWTGLLRSLNVRWLPGKANTGVDLAHMPVPDEPVYVEAISGAFMLVRREALGQAGLMDEGYFLHCEDLDWCKAFEEAGWKILFVPGIDIIHHKGVCSADRPIFVLWHKHRGMARFYRKFLSKQYSAPLNLLVILGVWLRFVAALPLNLLRRLSLKKTPPVTLPEPIEAIPALPLFEDLKERPVLVTGGTGFIGAHLMDELLRQHADLRALCRRPCSLERWPEVAMVQGDLTDPQSLEHVCEGVHTLFHLASHAHMLDAPANETSGHLRVTEQGTLTLVKLAEKAGVKRFVFVSSVKAMGEENDNCLDESITPRPETPYGQAKLHAERAVLAAAERSGMETVVLRLPMVYGPGNKGNLPRMVAAIRRGRFPPLPEVANRRSMIHVDDVVQALLLAAVKEQAAGQTYIATDGRDYSTREIHRLISLNLQKAPPRWHIPMALLKAGAKTGDWLSSRGLRSPLNSESLRKLFGSAWYRIDKIRDELGYQPRYDLQRALPDIVRENDQDAGSDG